MDVSTNPFRPPLARIVALDMNVGSARSTGEALFEQLYETRYREVFRYTMLMLRSRDDAEDATAETFKRAYSAIGAGRGPSGDALPWLYLIARRIVLNLSRRRRLIAWVPLASISPAREPRHATTEEAADFWMWFEALAQAIPDRQREVLILRFQRDLDDNQIGAILGLSASGVRSLASRAIESLRTHPELWS
jgi:RNA polymerase sigma-70 factor (ECF subfamily)